MPTKIGWTDETWPVLAGCDPISAGCDQCYAARDAATRLAHLPAYNGLAIKPAGEPARFTGEIRLRAENLPMPLRWARPRRVFVASQSDLFHPGVPSDYIAQVWAAMAVTQRHSYQVLTKRPNRATALTTSPWFREQVVAHTRKLLADVRYRVAPPIPEIWPLPNVDVGTSIEWAGTLWRAAMLGRADAALRWLSCEPLIGHPGTIIELRGALRAGRIGWVVVGCESGRQARPMNPDWARAWRDACAAEGVPLFVKQLTDHRHPMRRTDDIDQFPPDLRVRQFPGDATNL